jgi:hypothetical protein
MLYLEIFYIPDTLESSSIVPFQACPAPANKSPHPTPPLPFSAPTQPPPSPIPPLPAPSRSLKADDVDLNAQTGPISITGDDGFSLQISAAPKAELEGNIGPITYKRPLSSPLVVTYKSGLTIEPATTTSSGKIEYAGTTIFVNGKPKVGAGTLTPGAAAISRGRGGECGRGRLIERLRLMLGLRDDCTVCPPAFPLTAGRGVCLQGPQPPRVFEPVFSTLLPRLHFPTLSLPRKRLPPS